MFNVRGCFRSAMMSFCLRMLLCAATLGLLGGSSLAFFSHPFHVCIGQMEWNDSDRWEVALRVHPQDLEKELSKAVGKSISVEDEQFPQLVTDFLNDQFFVLRVPVDLGQQEIHQRNSEISKGTLRGAESTTLTETADENHHKDQTRSNLKWIGMESERGWVWIYLEMYPPRLERTNGLRDWLVHQLFLDTVERQENSVVIYPQPRTTSSKKYSLQFKKGQSCALMRDRD